jgi:hypothetical protein
MPCGVAPRGPTLEFHSPQRKHFRGRQVSGAMLVMDRERFDRLA